MMLIDSGNWKKNINNNNNFLAGGFLGFDQNPDILREKLPKTKKKYTSQSSKVFILIVSIQVMNIKMKIW